MCKNIFAFHLMLVLLCLTHTANALEDFRKPSAAGTFYPAEPEVLKTKVGELIRDAKTPPDTGRMIACIMPDSAYGFSGAVAAHAVKNIQEGDYESVIVLGTSHFVKFENCTVPAVRSFMTPMGFLPLDGEAIGKLNYSPMFWTKAIRYSGTGHHTPIHEKEYSIEVVLPFLQARLGSFKLVPILVGDLSNPAQGLNIEPFNAAAEELQKIVSDKTLIVVSSNLTHYGKEYNYTPFRDDVSKNIDTIDKMALDIISKLDAPEFINYLKKTKNPIPGYGAILLLMRTLPPGTTARVVAQDRSANIANQSGSDSSVTFAAVQFFAPPKAE